MYGKHKRSLLVSADCVTDCGAYAVLNNSHDVITSGLESVDMLLSLSDPQLIGDALKRIDAVDAAISAVGRAHFTTLGMVDIAPWTDSVYGFGLKKKLTGQVNLTLAACGVVKPGGSNTLTADATNDEPIIGDLSLIMASGTIEARVDVGCTDELP
jgi:hypothetical protein